MTSRDTALAASTMPWAKNKAGNPFASTSGRPNSAVMAKATPKNVLQIDMTSGRQRAGLICAISVGAATTMMR